MVTAEISVKLGNQEIFGMTVHYSGGDADWEHQVAFAAQASMQQALENVTLPKVTVGGKGEAVSDEPKTKLGKDLRAIRARIIASTDALYDWADLETVTQAEADGMARDAVEAEKERCQGILNDALGQTNPGSVRTAICRCIDRVVGRELSAPEPMTVARTLKLLKVRIGSQVGAMPRDWCDVEGDLVALVEASKQEQARTDAEICAGMAGSVARIDCPDAILKAAGLA